MSTIDWSPLYEMMDVDSMWQFFNKKCFVVDKHIPLKERINSRSEQWINDDILTEMHCREHLFKKATQSDDHAWNLYRASRNRFTKKIREAKHEFVEEAISQAENKPKDMWDKLKQFLPSKKTNTNCTILRDNNAVFKETRDIAECFNKYFCSIGHELEKHFDDTLPTVQDQMPKNSYTIPSITAEFIENEINRMSISKATGLDGISVKLLKLSSNSICDILAYIFNFSLPSCTFANDWKKARVTPLFKAGDECLV
jgi:hypothetical protein